MNRFYTILALLALTACSTAPATEESDPPPCDSGSGGGAATSSSTSAGSGGSAPTSCFDGCEPGTPCFTFTQCYGLYQFTFDGNAEWCVSSNPEGAQAWASMMECACDDPAAYADAVTCAPDSCCVDGDTTTCIVDDQERVCTYGIIGKVCSKSDPDC